jgi:hypothetical protein
MKSSFEKNSFFDKKELSDNYWFKIGEELYQERGKIPDPLEIRAAVIIKALDLPSAFYSAIETEPLTKKELIPKKIKLLLNI